MADLTQQERTERTRQVLENEAKRRGMTVTPDGRVREADAEILLGYAAGGLRSLREFSNAPAHYRAPVCGSRISYRLEDLASWLEFRREEPALQ